MMYNITGLKISLDHLNRTGIGYKLKFFLIVPLRCYNYDVYRSKN